MPKNMPWSITTRTDRSVTRHEHESRRRCISIGRDLGQSIFGASDLEVGPSGVEDLRTERTSGT